MASHRQSPDYVDSHCQLHHNLLVGCLHAGENLCTDPHESAQVSCSTLAQGGKGRHSRRVGQAWKGTEQPHFANHFTGSCAPPKATSGQCAHVSPSFATPCRIGKCARTPVWVPLRLQPVSARWERGFVAMPVCHRHCTGYTEDGKQREPAVHKVLPVLSTAASSLGGKL